MGEADGQVKRSLKLGIWLGTTSCMRTMRRRWTYQSIRGRRGKRSDGRKRRKRNGGERGWWKMGMRASRSCVIAGCGQSRMMHQCIIQWVDGEWS